jgi:hypothetical protein
MVFDSNNKPQYSVDPSDVCFKILKIFDQGLESIQNLTSIECKVMSHLLKTKAVKTFHKVPVKPTSMPEQPDRKNKKLLPDENCWLYE